MSTNSTTNTDNPKRKYLRYILWGVGIGVALLGILFAVFYKIAFAPNIHLATTNDTPTYLYIPTQATFSQVKDSLTTNKLIDDINSFERVATFKGYTQKIRSGRYRLTDKMNNNTLVSLLRSGKQTPVKLTFNNSVRKLDELAAKLSKSVEADSATLYALMTDEDYLKTLGFDPYTIPAMFVPNTYEVYWNTPAKQLMERMKKEYDTFWNDERRAKAQNIGLTPIQTATLASIVQAETNMADDRPKVAGVYMNRLRINMALQADPTLVWANNNFETRRVLNTHKTVESPYNTYLNTGLPPGPIGFPSAAYIESVLNYERHDYLYFVAKADFSGYSNFSTTYEQHMRYAAEYQRELSKRGIFK
jgi:UPF0755 protein